MDPGLSAQERALASLAGSQLKGILAPLTEWTCMGSRPGLGRTTTEGNQDRVLCARFTDRFGSQADVFVLCDGIGGMADGGRCAQIAAAAFLVSLSNRLSFGYSDPRALLRDAASTANRKVFAEYSGRGGTTLSCVLILKGIFYACTIGDTRIFAVDKIGARQLTVDDTMRSALAAAGQQVVDLGPEHDRLIQFVGMGADMQAHVNELEIGPAVRFVLLCTDGAYKLPGDLFSQVTTNAATARELVQRLLDVAKYVGVEDDASAVALSARLLEAAPHGEFLTQDGETTLLRVWGVAQIGEPAMMWFDPRKELPFARRPTPEPMALHEPTAEYESDRQRRNRGAHEASKMALAGVPARPSVGGIVVSVGSPPAGSRGSKRRAKRSRDVIIRADGQGNLIADASVGIVHKPMEDDASEKGTPSATAVPVDDDPPDDPPDDVGRRDDDADDEDRIRRRQRILK